MRIELSSSAQEKMEQMLDHLYTRFDLEELMPDELADALVSLGHDLVSTDDSDLFAARDRLVDYCVRKVGVRIGLEESFHEEEDYRG